MEQQVKPVKSEIYNYTQSNLPTACVNDCSKVKMNELVRSLLQFIVPGIDFSDHADQWIIDLLFPAKAQTFKI